MPSTTHQSKAERIEQVKANLPLPEQPPVAPDWNSSDSRTVNVGSGGVESDISTSEGSSSGLREPVTAGSEVREGGVDLSKVGRQGKDNLKGLPKDALKK
jgi:hypothetical protein